MALLSSKVILRQNDQKKNDLLKLNLNLHYIKMYKCFILWQRG